MKGQLGSAPECTPISTSSPRSRAPKRAQHEIDARGGRELLSPASASRCPSIQRGVSTGDAGRRRAEGLEADRAGRARRIAEEQRSPRLPVRAYRAGAM